LSEGTPWGDSPTCYAPSGAKNASLMLIASLPRNDPELALAALAGGEDVANVHIDHRSQVGV